jgi:hypothetical protein
VHELELVIFCLLLGYDFSVERVRDVRAFGSAFEVSKYL